MSVIIGNAIRVQFDIPQTELLAGTAIELIAPTDGYIVGLETTVQTAITTGGDISVKTGDALGTTVAGITQTIANGATKGTRKFSSSTRDSTTTVVKKGDRVAIQSASFASAGAIKGTLVFSTADATR